MKAYISVSFSKRKLLDKEIKAIIETLNDFKISPFVFVDNYKFDVIQEKEMMQKAVDHIDDCDLLIAETSDKGIGSAIFWLTKKSLRQILRNEQSVQECDATKLNSSNPVWFKKINRQEKKSNRSLISWLF